MEAKGRLLKWLLWVPAFSLVLFVPLPLYADSSKLVVEPDLVRIGVFFDGARVNLLAEIPEGCDAVIEVTGKTIKNEVMQKVRHWDLWMNEGEIEIIDAPCLYLAMSNEPAPLSNPGADVPWGYEALKKRVSFTGEISGARAEKIFREFFHLKENRGLYGMFPGALKVSHTSGNRSIVRGSFRLSSRVTPGTYRVSLSVSQKGRILSRKSVSLKVIMVGFPALVYRLANDHPFIYGFLAIAIAVVAGLVAGLVFGKLRKISPR